MEKSKDQENPLRYTPPAEHLNPSDASKFIAVLKVKIDLKTSQGVKNSDGK